MQYHSLGKEHPPSKECPPTTFDLISHIRSKFNAMGAHSSTLLSLGTRLHTWRWYLSRDPPCVWFSLSFSFTDFSHAGDHGCLRLRSTVPKAVVYCNYTSYSISIVKFNALILCKPKLIFILNKLQSNSTWTKYNYSERNKLLFKNAPTYSNAKLLSGCKECDPEFFLALLHSI